MSGDIYGLVRHKLYRIPAVSVSYHPELANRRVWFAGSFKDLPAGGGQMALFRFADDPPAGHAETVWLRPFAVVEVK